MPVIHKARKNDVIVVETNSSHTDTLYKRVEYKYYFLAFAAKVTRKGIVERWRQPGGMDFCLDKNQRVFVIRDVDRQRAAGELLRDAGFKNHFDDPQKIRDVINDRVEALR
jgi:hypothetical protein